jgi:hypothetical protein
MRFQSRGWSLSLVFSKIQIGLYRITKEESKIIEDS